MTLTKGFLRRTSILNKQMVHVGLLIWPLFSFGLYGVCYSVREGFRVVPPTMGLGPLIVLNPDQNFWYNLFYGSIAVVIGFYFFIKFVFEGSMDFRDKTTKLRQRHILHEQGFTTWAFLYAFGQMMVVLGITYITMPLEFEIDFLKDYFLLLILIPVVLFLNIWPLILRNIGKKTYKWMAYSLLLVSALSVGLANINFWDYRKINQTISARNVQSTYGLQVPLSKSHVLLSSFPALNFYIVKDSLRPNEPRIFVGDTRTPLRLDEVKSFLTSNKNRYNQWRPSKPAINLHIDEKINLGFVNDLKQELREAGGETILYSTGGMHSKYPSFYPGFKNSGIPELLHPFYPGFVSFLDSAENLDFRKYAIKTHESDYYRIQGVRRYKRMTIKVTPEQVFLNNREISAEDLQAYTYKFVKKYSPEYMIIFEPDERISYQRYIAYKDIIMYSIDQLRYEMSYTLFNQPFDYWYRDPEYVKLREIYPKRVLEWTREEKRLMDIMSRMRAVKR